VAERVDGPWLEELPARVDAGGPRSAGEGGFRPELIKAVSSAGWPRS
jgi:hypothetical protein